MKANPAAVQLHCTIEYRVEGGVSPVLMDGTARGHPIGDVADMGPLAPTYLFCYGDASVRAGRDATLFENAHATAREQPRRELLLEAYGGSARKPAVLPADARFCFNAFVTSVNDFGDHEREDCGAATVLVSDLVSAITKNAGPDPYALDIALRVHSTSRNRQTGAIRLTARRLTVAPDLRFAPLKSFQNVDSNLEHIGRQLDAYLVRFGEENRLFVPRIRGVENIDCPVYPGEVTVCDTQMRLPVGAFMRFEVPRVSALYWRTALDVLADRQGFPDATAFGEHYGRLALKDRCNAAGKLLFQYVQQLDYVADRTSAPGTTSMRIGIGAGGSGEIKKHGRGPRPKESIEMFGDALAVLCGDCEDLAVGNAQFHEAFCRGFKVEGADTPANRTLRDMQRLMRLYVGHVVVEGVTSAAATDDTSAVEVRGAHAALKLVPRDLHYRWLANWKADHLMVTDAPAFPSEFRDKLPVVVGEGTGMVEPVATEDDAPAARALLNECPALASAKKPLRPPFGTSPFYKALVFSVTRDFYADYRTSAFRFALRDGPDGFTKGVRFGDFIRRSPDILLVPFGFTAEPRASVTASVNGVRPATRVGNLLEDGRSRSEYTGEMTRIIDSVCKTRLPVPPIDCDPREPALDRSPVPALERVRALFKGASVPADAPRVQAYLHMSQPRVEQRADDLIDFCRRLPGVFLAMDYTLERLDRRLSVYRLDFYCDEAVARATLARLERNVAAG